MKNLVLQHDLYNRTEFCDYKVEQVVLEEKVFPYLEEHKLNTASSYRTLINDIEPEELRELVSKIATVNIAGGARMMLTGKDPNLPFQADLAIQDSINCLQVGISFWCREGQTKAIKDLFKELLKDLSSNVAKSTIIDVDWFYHEDKKLASHSLKEIIYEVVHQEAYPYLEMDKFIDGYFKSSSSIMIMSGVPGTGKTKLIRHIMRKATDSGANFLKLFRLKHRYEDDEPGASGRVFAKKDPTDLRVKIAYTTDIGVLHDENFYVQIRTNGYHFVVLEDIDFKLNSRKDGNELMHKFLALSDGFISSNVKVILSTNLEVGEIDDALTRPGRCYAAIETRRLNFEEASKLLVKLGTKVPALETGEYSVADIYAHAYGLSYKDGKETKKRLGFGSRKK
jgi:hypothetical protein